MRRPRRLLIWTLASMAFIVIPGAVYQQQPESPALPRSLFAPELAELRIASVTWENRKGPAREVVDIVCLVPDVPTFFEALATWDDTRFFPILIDDAETNLKFLRAFRPAKVVRFPKAAEPVPPEGLWQSALDAVGRSWTGADDAPQDGGSVPKDLGPTPPGVVVSAPESPSLAGAVALAAGHFQPLLRWDVPKGAKDEISSEEALTLVNELQLRIDAKIKDYGKLGDSCDFITLAGDWPYRYVVREGEFPGTSVLDDLIGRGRSGERWAYAGRLIGDPEDSVYRAMCSLFLQPEKALLFNSYEQQNEPWATYDMAPAARRLGERLSEVSLRHRAGSVPPDLAGWHRAFDPMNQAGLVLINSKGGPDTFDLPGGTALTADVPLTDPAAVLMIHSFSAANPADPGTIAGRWLANGAFLYFGAVHEPYLVAFRTPTLVADLIAEYLPFVAVARTLPREPFGLPWRLIYLGDPLYRLRPPEERRPRIDGKEFGRWPSYTETAPPAADQDNAALAWVLKTALARSGREGKRGPAADLIDRVLRIRRARLALNLRPIYDAVATDTLMRAGRYAELRQRLSEVPDDEASAELQRWLETCRMADLHQALAAKDLPRAFGIWNELVRSDASANVKTQLTARVAALADSPLHKGFWRKQLRATLPAVQETPVAEVIEKELQRIGP